MSIFLVIAIVATLTGKFMPLGFIFLLLWIITKNTNTKRRW